MADYNDLKVTELKEELKKRGIPTTSLTRKQQIVDRLIEDDKEKNTTENDEDAQEESDAHSSAAQDSEQAEPTNAQISSEHVQESLANVDEQADQDTKMDIANGHAEAGSPTEITDPIEPTPAEPAALEISAVPVDQPVPESLPAQDENMSETTPAPAQDSVDVPASPTSTSQDQHVDGTPDNRKRKRRSLTPPVREESVSKKLKHVDAGHGDVAQLEVEGGLPANGATESNEDSHVDMPDAPDAPDAPLESPDAAIQPMATSDDVIQVSATTPTMESNVEPTTDIATRRGSNSAQNKPTRSPNQRRFKDMLNRPASSADQHVPQSPIDDGVEVSPALHPATRSLYIRDLLRPINVNALRDHLEQLATPPGQSSSGQVVEECFIDTLKTHAFVMFASISAASRARASFHARVWPSEAQRKPLWVDFIPEERMSVWIDQERAEGGTRASTARRWEVAYDVLDDKVDVSLVEATAASQSRPSFAQGMPGAPLGPRGSMAGPQRSSFSQSDNRRPSHASAPPRPTVKAVEEASASFLELDKLFRFTTAKPKLYWQPVSEELADKRLDEIDRETSRDWDPKKDAKLNGSALGRGLDQLKRYTFEDGDVLVDGGPEFGGGAAFGVGRGGGDSYRGGGRGGGGRRGADRYR